MRIATWNVNSLKARLEKVEWWLERAAPDVLLMQETKLSDDDAPVLPFRMLGYELLHHGEGRWNGVAIASRVGIEDVVTNFGDGAVRNSGPGATAPGEEDFDPGTEARMVSAVCGGVRVVSIYAPNGRVVDSPWYAGKLRWFARLRAVARGDAGPGGPAPRRGRLQRGPDRRRRLERRRGARRHPRVGARNGPPSGHSLRGDLRTRGVPRTPASGASPGGTTGRATSSATRGCGSTTCWRPRRQRRVSSRWRSIARRARASRRRPITRRSSSTSTSPGTPFDAGWGGSEERFAARRAAHRG